MKTRLNDDGTEVILLSALKNNIIISIIGVGNKRNRSPWDPTQISMDIYGVKVDELLHSWACFFVRDKSQADVWCHGPELAP